MISPLPMIDDIGAENNFLPIFSPPKPQKCMSQKEAFIRDLRAEAGKTRKMLERVPYDQATWKPHEKSMDLGGLTRHIANLPLWVGYTLLQDELDFAKPMNRPKVAESTEEVLANFDAHQAQAMKILEETNDEVLDSDWSMRNGEMIFFTRPKKEVLREFVHSHIIHHRAQLSVYLRLLNIPIPGMYGPSADER